MASARRVGTNEQVTSYGNCTRTYSALSDWEVATDTNHVSDMETDVLECYDDSASFDDDVNVAGSTNDATFFRIVRPASGEGHDGTSNNGVYFNSTTTGNMLRIAETFSAYEDLIATLTTNNSVTRNAFFIPGVSTRLVGCIGFDGSNSGSGECRGFNPQGDLHVTVLCLSENNAGDNFLMGPGGGNTQYIYNCVGIENLSGHCLRNTSGTVVTKNCLMKTATGDCFEAGTYTGSDFDAASDTTDPDSGGSNRVSQTFTFVNAAGNNYHLAAGDGGAKDFGQSLAADGVFAFDDDIDGDLFGAWDIGFDESTTGPFGRSRSVGVDSTTNGTDHSVTLPSVVIAGDTIIVVFATDGSETVTWPNEGTEWIELFTTNRDGLVTVSVAWKKAIGDESDEVITVTTGTVEQASYSALVIGGAEDPTTTPPESVNTTGDDDSPNPPSQPADDAADFLFIAGFGSDRDRTIDAIPTSYRDRKTPVGCETGCTYGGQTCEDPF